MTTMTTTLPDLSQVKARQQATWSTGDYGVIGTTLTLVGETLCESVDLQAGQSALDVATGNGATALAAARRGADVTGLDYVPALLHQARERTAAERLPIRFIEGDAECLPFPDASFDTVLSTFGVMFTPDQRRAAQELVRVCRSGGKIGLASWTPESFIGQVFRVLGRYNPPPPGLYPPMAWGAEAHLDDLLGDAVEAATAVQRTFVFRYRSAEHWLDTFRTYYGPIHRAFAALPPERQEALRAELLELLERSNRSGGASLSVPSEYLEYVATRR